MASAAWRAEFERGRAAGAAARAAGRSQADREDGWWASRAFRSGYAAGHDPDAPAELPPPPAWSLGEAALWAALRPWSERGDRRTRLLALLALAFLVQRLRTEAERWRARRAGLVRAADAPPEQGSPEVAGARLLAGWAVQWDARRRGAWPPSTATRLGLAVPFVLDAELRWRRWARGWDASAPR